MDEMFPEKEKEFIQNCTLSQMGPFHADDMSGILLECYWKMVHKEPYHIQGQVKHYQDYWAKQ